MVVAVGQLTGRRETEREKDRTGVRGGLLGCGEKLDRMLRLPVCCSRAMSPLARLLLVLNGQILG